MAVNDFYKNDQGEEQQTTQWVECKINGKRSEVLKPYILKGMALYVDGKATASAWQPTDTDKKAIGEPKAKLGIQVRELRFLESKPNDAQTIPEDLPELSDQEVEDLFPKT